MSKKSEINFKIELDDNKVPEKIEWNASDAGFSNFKDCRSLMLSLWDPNDRATLGIDLWTKEMLVDDMNIHFHQTFLKMADTYRRATKNSEVADLIQNFSQEFADKLNLKEKIKKK